MAGGRNVMPRSKSRILVLFSLSLLIFSLLFFLSSLSTPTTPHLPPATTATATTTAETSFVTSLQDFLAHKSPSASDDTVRTPLTEDDVIKLDDAVFRSESGRLYADPYYPVGLPLRVYVYDMPRKFTYDLLWLFMNTYKETSNLTSNGSPVHRLIEQHSIDYWLWADLIAPQSERLLRSVVRVHRQEEADLFYIPFFTTISFFLMEKQQCKALYRVKL